MSFVGIAVIGSTAGAVASLASAVSTAVFKRRHRSDPEAPSERTITISIFTQEGQSTTFSVQENTQVAHLVQELHDAAGEDNLNVTSRVVEQNQ
jgi:hypothetical protein